MKAPQVYSEDSIANFKLLAEESIQKRSKLLTEDKLLAEVKDDILKLFNVGYKVAEIRDLLKQSEINISIQKIKNIIPSTKSKARKPRTFKSNHTDDQLDKITTINTTEA